MYDARKANEARVVVQASNILLVAHDRAAPYTEDLEELVVEALGLAPLARPLARERGRPSAHLDSRQAHGRPHVLISVVFVDPFDLMMDPRPNSYSVPNREPRHLVAFDQDDWLRSPLHVLPRRIDNPDLLW